MTLKGSPLRADDMTVPGEEILAWQAELDHLDGLPEMRGRLGSPGEDTPVGGREKHPTVETVLVDADGYLLVREWSASERGIPDQGSVFSPEGRWLGVLPIPPDPAPRAWPCVADTRTPAGCGRTTS